MKVLFDHQAFSNQKYGGISRYFANLYNGLNNQDGTSAKLGLLFTDNGYINNKQLPAGALNNYIKKQSRRLKYNKWYDEYLIKHDNFDVFHPTYYNPYFLKSLKKPFVLTVHDMIYELFPQYFENDPYTPNYKKEVIERADHIIAISECTKNDIKKFYKLPDDKITVVHHGYQMQVDEEKAPPFIIDGDFILFIGERGYYKNFELFIKAAASIVLKHSIKIICAGGGTFNVAETAFLDKFNIKNSVQQLTVTDAQLKNLYETAIAFVFPSLYEGFGIPVLEAFFNNCPVILSDSSSLPEVAGDAGQYFDPKSEESISNAIKQVVIDEAKRNEMRKMGKERLKLFQFENCLQKTSAVYKLLA